PTTLTKPAVDEEGDRPAYTDPTIFKTENAVGVDEALDINKYTYVDNNDLQNTESAINLTVRNGDENAYTTRAVTVVANVKLSGVTKNYGGGYIEFILPP
ncbi:hypothetical protein, partial [Streptococcus equi]|uniref:hypothetical protein n=1 Tax=Streptococcus equi TaxID=1336 RepID=UPI000B2D6A94